MTEVHDDAPVGVLLDLLEQCVVSVVPVAKGLCHDVILAVYLFAEAFCKNILIKRIIFNCIVRLY